MSATAGNRGLVALIKRGMNEIPEIMLSGALGLFGIGMGSTAVYLYYQNDGDNRRHKENYTVYRHDDPRVSRIRTD